MTKKQSQPVIECAVYARFSSDQQREASIDDQLRNCRDFAKQRGWKILDEQIYADHAVTGTARDRVQLQALLENALRESPPFQYVLVDDTSRLARDVVLSVETVRRLKFNGVFLYAVTQNIDTARDDAEDFLVMSGMMDARFVRDLAHKTHRGLTGQALKGRATGGKALGYTTEPILEGQVDAHGSPIPVGWEYVVNPEEAKLVQRIFRLYGEDGLGLRSVAILLNEEGIPNPRAGKNGDRGGWSHTTIRAILRNERYTGKVVWNRTHWQKVPGSRKRRPVVRPCEEWKVTERSDLAIIDPVLWGKTQSRMKHVEDCYGERVEGRFVKPRNRAAAGSPYLLSGRLRCGVCGGNMSVTGGDRNGKDGRRYGCSQHASKGPTVCANSLSIKTTLADEAIAAEIRERLLTPRKLEEAAEILREELAAAIKDSPNQEAVIRDNLVTVDRERANFVRAIANGVDSQSIAEALKKADTRREALLSELANVQTAPSPADVVLLPNAARFMLDDLTSTLMLDVPAAREALRQYLGPITMRPIEHDGVKTYVAEGALDATRALGDASSPDKWSRTAYVSVVAGPRFELGTFGL